MGKEKVRGQSLHFIYVYRDAQKRPRYVGYGRTLNRATVLAGRNKKFREFATRDAYTVEICGPFHTRECAMAAETALISAMRPDCNISHGQRRYRFRDSKVRRAITVLWQWRSAENVEGHKVTKSGGGQMRGVREGDRLFIWATREDELYALGVLDVERISSTKPYPRVFGRPVSGTFQKIPLGKAKWRLRFVGSKDRLRKRGHIAHQVRVHRILTPDSADMLLNLLRRRGKRRVSP